VEALAHYMGALAVYRTLGPTCEGHVTELQVRAQAQPMSIRHSSSCFSFCVLLRCLVFFPLVRAEARGGHAEPRGGP
jgi:hypothetical protein